ncbi:MAG: rRNA maturation RNase YbeY [Ignavibacteria bacterium]|nr:MAG: rRNA maturation RNase YbeY [Ignavibacteria bacterium]
MLGFCGERDAQRSDLYRGTSGQALGADRRERGRLLALRQCRPANSFRRLHPAWARDYALGDRPLAHRIAPARGENRHQEKTPVIRIGVYTAASRPPLAREETIRIARRVLTRERRRRAHIAIIYINDRSMIRMNAAYLKRRRTTDVLSFPLSDLPDDLLEGEVYVNVDRARRQARRYGVTFRNEVARLVIHGVLHLLDYDDKRESEKRQMTRLEDAYLRICC